MILFFYESYWFISKIIIKVPIITMYLSKNILIYASEINKIIGWIKNLILMRNRALNQIVFCK